MRRSIYRIPPSDDHRDKAQDGGRIERQLCINPVSGKAEGPVWVVEVGGKTGTIRELDELGNLVFSLADSNARTIFRPDEEPRN